MSIINNIFAALLDVGGNSGTQINIPTASANSILQNALNIVYMAAGIVAVIVIIAAGVTMATSSSSPESIAKAKNWILFACIGLVAVGLAFAITNFVIGVLL